MLQFNQMIESLVPHIYAKGLLHEKLLIQKLMTTTQCEYVSFMSRNILQNCFSRLSGNSL